MDIVLYSIGSYQSLAEVTMRDLHFGWMTVCVGFKDDRLERIPVRTVAIRKMMKTV